MTDVIIIFLQYDYLFETNIIFLKQLFITKHEGVHLCDTSTIVQLHEITDVDLCSEAPGRN